MNNIVKVDMIPKSFGVRTLSCSQGDTKREFKFTLNDANGTIDTSDVEIALPQFPVYKGGTEEILPTNGSVPSTAPIIADIQYPQGLLNDQEFLYRESPTEEDGLAKITDIKGNTLVWNQLVQNGNFADKSNWIEANATFTVNNNVATMVASATYGNIEQILSVKANHMYFATCDIKLTTGTNFNLIQFRPYVGVSIPCVSTTEWQTLSGMFIPTTSASVYYPRITDSRASGWDAIQIRNCMVIDLTQMGLDITEPSEFTSLFPLSFYDFNQGTLIPFSGNGIKTVGKNLLSYSGENLPYNANGVSITREDNIYKVVASNPSGYPFARISTIHYLPKGQYTVTMLGAESSNTGVAWRLIDRNVSPVKIFVNASATTTTFTLNEDAHDVYFEITIDASKLTTGTWDVRFQLNIGTPSDYEPYTSTTTDLPISTYFPTGMKSAGSVYDELTNSKAITRIGEVDLGTLTWVLGGSGNFYDTPVINDLIPSSINIKSSRYTTGYSSVFENDSSLIGFSIAASKKIRFYNSGLSSASEVASALSGVYFYYELATETETEITSASLVTENGEIQLLPQGDYLVGTVNSSVSRKSGMFDAKVRLTDGDGTVYSNKLQLYVERSPK